MFVHQSLDKLFHCNLFYDKYYCKKSLKHSIWIRKQFSINYLKNVTNCAKTSKHYCDFCILRHYRWMLLYTYTFMWEPVETQWCSVESLTLSVDGSCNILVSKDSYCRCKLELVSFIIDNSPSLHSIIIIMIDCY